MKTSNLKELMKRCKTGLFVIGLLLAPGLYTYLVHGLLAKDPRVAPATAMLAKTPGAESTPTNLVTLSFELLKSWTYVEKNMTPIPDVIQRLDGHAVDMIGYMMPLSEIKNVTQFVLVPSLWGCCYGQPPAVNHVIVVNMTQGLTTRFFDDMIRVRGTFHVGAAWQDGYLISLYTITAQSITAK